jgi:hypothetical protein
MRRGKSQSACLNLTLRVEIVRVQITLVRVEIAVVSVRVTMRV